MQAWGPGRTHSGGRATVTATMTVNAPGAHHCLTSSEEGKPVPTGATVAQTSRELPVIF